MKIYRLLIVIILLLFSLPWQVSADIYMFIDSSGVVHFTNVPTSTDYKLYIRERPVRGKRAGNTGIFDSEISKASRRFGVDSSLVKAVIAVESDFNPKAVSKRGAKGLMQIMPDNYQSLRLSDPFDPSQNIMGGTLYLKRLFARYNGKLPLVLAAYNAGPQAVDRYNTIPPFKETEKYIKKVMERYNIYNSTF